MSSGPDQNLQDLADDGTNDSAPQPGSRRPGEDTEETRGQSAGAGRSAAAEPATLGTRIAYRLKQWGITLSYLVIAVAIIALIRTFVIQSFTIPSGSMEDTLNEGDRVTVTMYDSHDIERGDVVVFTDPDHWLMTQEPTGLQGALQDFLVTIRIFPQDAGHHLIKRVIGMPGDHVVADGNGSLSVNGVELDEDYLKPGRSASDLAFDVTVPEGYVWVMGDNRANSSDSRYHQNDAHHGFVPIDNVVGVAKNVVWPYSHWSSLSSGHKVFSQVPQPTSTPTAIPAEPAAPVPTRTLAGSES
ncbi:signal peptidase I [Actinomyces sp. ZJ308]|uniref:signal peptidase I n=1 Tax=Actinomyces sp. ZJ308 TaxID=2708342 RepID=UPI00141F17B5|nr:signal peptidase I [Actinomyces sp. ZJ308]